MHVTGKRGRSRVTPVGDRPPVQQSALHNEASGEDGVAFDVPDILGPSKSLQPVMYVHLIASTHAVLQTSELLWSGEACG